MRKSVRWEPNYSHPAGGDEDKWLRDWRKLREKHQTVIEHVCSKEVEKTTSVSQRACLLSSYSIDEGESWNSYKFTNQSAIRIYGILTEPGEKTTVFSIFGSKPDHHSWILFQLNVSGLLGQYSPSPLLTLPLLLLPQERTGWPKAWHNSQWRLMKVGAKRSGLQRNGKREL